MHTLRACPNSSSPLLSLTSTSKQAVRDLAKGTAQTNDPIGPVPAAGGKCLLDRHRLSHLTSGGVPGSPNVAVLMLQGVQYPLRPVMLKEKKNKLFLPTMPP